MVAALSLDPVAMRLLNVHTKQVEEIIGREKPAYAILSHTWGKEEVLFEDLRHAEHQRSKYEDKAGYAKIQGCCRQAVKDGHEYVWIDTCCIDKSSSSELSEAINSMFQWYQSAAVCYVYLVDVPVLDDPFAADCAFRRSRWFTRGWTLQELIAPGELVFFNAIWMPIFDKCHYEQKDSLIIQDAHRRSHSSSVSDTRLSVTGTMHLLEEITGIDKGILDGTISFTSVPVALRLSWASKRQTTRNEDMAYCLLGLVQVNMPLLYGEGERAFVRMQEEILKNSNSLSILAWGFGQSWSEIRSLTNDKPQCVFAPSPALFRCFKQLNWEKYWARDITKTHSTLTNYGLHIGLLLLRLDPKRGTYMGLIHLYREYNTTKARFVAIPLTQRLKKNVFIRTIGSKPFILSVSSWATLYQLKRKWRTIYIQEPRDPALSVGLTDEPHEILGISFPQILSFFGVHGHLYHQYGQDLFVNGRQLFRQGYDVHSIYPSPRLSQNTFKPDYSNIIHSRAFPLRITLFSKAGHRDAIALLLTASAKTSLDHKMKRDEARPGRESQPNNKIEVTAYVAHADSRHLAMEYFLAEFVSGAPPHKRSERPRQLGWSSSILIRDPDEDNGSDTCLRVSAVCKELDCSIVAETGPYLQCLQRRQ